MALTPPRPLAALARRGARARWTPAQLSGLTARWQASAGFTNAGKTIPCSANGDPAYVIADSTGNGYDLVQSTAGNRYLWHSTQGTLCPTRIASQTFPNSTLEYPMAAPFDARSSSAFFLVALQTRNWGFRNFLSTSNLQFLTSSNNGFNYPSSAYFKLAASNYPTYPHGGTQVPTGLALIGFVANGTALTLVVNGHAETVTWTPPGAAGTGRYLLGEPDLQGNWNGSFREAWLVNRAATPTEIGLIQTYAQSQGCVFDAPSVVVYDGDSISDAQPDDLRRGWQYFMGLGPLALEYSNAIGGLPLSTMLANAPTFTDSIHTAGKNNVAVVFGGTNDVALNGRTAAQVYADTQSYGAGRKTAGFKVVVVGMLPRGGVETQRQTLRSSMLADFPTATSSPLVYRAGPGVTYADYYVDLGGDSVMGANGNTGNTTYYADGVHPTLVGYQYLSPIIRPALTLAGVV